MNEQQRKLHGARAQYDKSITQRNALLGAGASVGAAGAAIGAPVLKAVSEYATAEDAAMQLRVSLMGADGKAGAEFARINAMATELGNRLPGTTADFQNMMTMLVRQGIPVQNILGGVGKATAYIGVQLKMAPDAAAEFTAKLQDATRTTNDDMLALTDTIQRAYYLGVDPNNMLEAFKGLGPAMDLIKQKGLEGANALAPFVVMLDQAGMRGEASGNAMRKVISRGLDVDNVNKVLDGLKTEKGIDIQLDFTNGKGEFGGVPKMIAELSKLKHLDTVTRLQVLKDIYGDDKETNEALSKIIDKGQQGYDDVIHRMQDQASLQQRVNNQLGTLRNLWDATSGTMTNALVAWGEAIAPEVKAVTEWLGGVAEGVGTWARENPRLSSTLMKIAAILAVVLVVTGALMVAMAGVLGPMIIIRHGLAMLALNAGTGAGSLGILGSAFKWLGGIVATVGRAMLLNPIGLVITAIAVAAYLIYRYWAPIKQFFAGVWAWIDGVFDRYPILNRIFPFIGAARLIINNWEAIRQFFAGLWGEVARAFDGGIAGIGALLLNWSPLGLFHRAFAAVLAWFAIDIPAKFTDFGRMVVDGLVGGIVAKWDAAKAKPLKLVNQLPAGVRKVLRINSPSRVFATIGGWAMAGLTQGLGRGSGAPLGAMLDTARRLTTAGASIVIGATAGPAQADSAPLRLDTRPPLSARTGAGVSVAGDQVTIQISVGPGQYLAELRSMLAQLLDERDRTKAARMRSMLSDRD
ncbi:phage tail tape measure protein [Chitiniphilus shinanonensis]|uniref:Phage tail tape measure protein n=1 Tax=Chitiniphilus shinanonensis TaxID=553088 RepID=A0ABQ6BUC2_9NEIS|nr:phage tail tape measure protein [Chitiniphilus shinanonensis]GLS03498.1 phage tail tape measure protein [Chitiniphilus shinanonensis]